MRLVVLALTVAFVACEPHHLALEFAAGKTYIYKYETLILGGLPEEGLSRAGLNFTSKVLISAQGQNNYMLKLEDYEFYEYNGIWPQDKFVKASTLTSELAVQLDKAIKFEYAGGMVNKMYAPQGVAPTVLNIYRGILGILQLNIKKTHNVYELQEDGTQGMCKTLYAISEDQKAERIILTKTRDMNHCQEKIFRDMGLAYMEKCVKCQEDIKNLRGVTTYNYVLKEVEGGIEVQDVRAVELIQFSPFNEKKGAAQMETRQSLIFQEYRQSGLQPVSAQYTHHGSLKYEIPIELIHTPIQMIKTESKTPLVVQIEEILKHLVTHNEETVHEDAPMKFVELFQLLRKMKSEDLTNLWKKYINMPAYRRWILDSITVTATPASLQFFKDQLLAKQPLANQPLAHQQQVEQPTIFEVAQALIGSIHMVTANNESLELFQMVINNEQFKEKPLQREILLLGYGTMIYRQCSENAVCSAELPKSIHDHFTKSDMEKEENVILYLKALGNAGHPASLKKISKYLPIHGTAATNHPTKVHVEAIMAMRNIAKKEPRMVQEYALQLFMDKALPPELRMLSCIVMFETKPPMALVITLANIVKREKNLQVASFTYSHMKSLTRCTSPIHASLAAACNVALKILGPQLDRLSLRYSRAIHMETYNSPYMLGAAASAFYINDAATILPKSIMAKSRAYIAGAAADILEVGVRTEGLQEALLKNPSLLNNADRINKMKRVISALSQWRSQPNSKPLASFYVKLFGQEVAYANIDKTLIDHAIELAGKVRSKEQEVRKLGREAVQTLQDGASYHFAKPLLITEVRRILPTIAGIPMELGLYTAAVTAAKIKVAASITPALEDNFALADLWQKDIRLNTEIRPSAVANSFAVMGVNTAYIQAALVTRAKLNFTSPVKIAANFNMQEERFKIEALPVSVPETFAAAEVESFATTRMTDETAPKLTPIIPVKRSQSRSTEILTSKITSSAAISVSKSSEILSQEEQADRQNQSRVFKKKYCSKLVGVGLKACFKVATQNVGYLQDAALYKVAGRHAVALSLKPIEGETVERLEIEVGVGQKAAEKLIKQITLSQEAIREGRPILMKLKKILVSNAGNSSSSSSSSSSSTLSSSSSSSSKSSSSSSSSRPSSKANDATVQLVKPRRSRRRSSSSSSNSSNSSNNSSSSSSSHSSRSSSSSSSSLRSSRRRSSSSSSSSSSSVRSRSRSSSSSSASSLASLFSGSSSSSSSSSRLSKQSKRFRKNHKKQGHKSKATSSARYGSTSSASSFENVYKQKKFLGSEAAVLAIVFRAVKANNKMQGYQVATYLDKPTARLQVILAPLAVDYNWKICADGVLSSEHKAMARFGWGPECSKYDTTVTAETGLVGKKPAARLRVHWKRIPSTLKRYAKMASKSIPSRMLSDLFRGKDRNSTKQISLTVVKASPRSLEFIWKTLRRNVYELHLPINLPLDISHLFNNSIDDIISHAGAAECLATQEAMKTFNNRTYSNKTPQSCYQILAADCTEDLKFIVLLKKDEHERSHINIKIADIDIDLYQKNSEMAAAINSREIPISQSYQHPTEGIKVRQIGEGISVVAPKYGLTEVYFEKSSWKIKVADWMRGQTCGVCGKADGEIRQEYRTPSGRLAKNEESHTLSWIVPGQSCRDVNECHLKHESVRLEKQVDIRGQNTRCYSVEPVLRCLPGCFPVKTRQVSVGFHCLPADANLNGVNMYERSEDLRENAMAHIACRCTAQCV